MSALVVVHSGAPRYGAVELKRVAHRYMFEALSISILLHFGIIGSYYLSAILGTDAPRQKLPPGWGPVVIYDGNPPIPGIIEIPRPPRAGLPKTGDKGTPVPVPDAPDVMDKTIATQGELGDAVDPHGAEIPVVVPEDVPITIEDQAPVDTFRIVEKAPMLVKSVLPVYPPTALRAELEGKVFVKMWVDRQGKVHDPVVLKTSGDIFNDAALEAARQCVFTPAYMTNGPVPVWVVLPFNFTLKGPK